MLCNFPYIWYLCFRNYDSSVASRAFDKRQKTIKAILAVKKFPIWESIKFLPKASDNKADFTL